eukprot:251770-Chlamydomonas_euryale.AAC.1
MAPPPAQTSAAVAAVVPAAAPATVSSTIPAAVPATVPAALSAVAPAEVAAALPAAVPALVPAVVSAAVFAADVAAVVADGIGAGRAEVLAMAALATPAQRLVGPGHIPATTMHEPWSVAGRWPQAPSVRACAGGQDGSDATTHPTVALAHPVVQPDAAGAAAAARSRPATADSSGTSSPEPELAGAANDDNTPCVGSGAAVVPAAAARPGATSPHTADAIMCTAARRALSWASVAFADASRACSRPSSTVCPSSTAQTMPLLPDDPTLLGDDPALLPLAPPSLPDDPPWTPLLPATQAVLTPPQCCPAPSCTPPLSSRPSPPQLPRSARASSSVTSGPSAISTRGTLVDSCRAIDSNAGPPPWPRRRSSRHAAAACRSSDAPAGVAALVRACHAASLSANEDTGRAAASLGTAMQRPAAADSVSSSLPSQHS